MQIKVIGKAHLKGTSKKTGNDYDFIQVHYNGRARGVEGLAALTLGYEAFSEQADIDFEWVSPLQRCVIHE